MRSMMMEELYETYRPLLFVLAYQLTGSSNDAEDAVQDVFLKLHDVEPERLHSPKAYLCKMVTNRCLDMLTSARKRREQYVGEWLPDPIWTPEEGAFESIIHHNLLSYAMLVLMERLTPVERAVFVLREALSFDYPAIAELVDKTETNCRKLMSRAKGKMGISESDLKGSVSMEWLQDFIGALSSGSADAVMSLLAEDVVLVSDGGGKAPAAIRPIHTRDHVARFLFGLLKQASANGQELDVKLVPLNGETGIVVRSKGALIVAAIIQTMGGVAKNIYFIRNPDKLQRILRETY